MCMSLLALPVRWPEGAQAKAFTLQFRVVIAIGFLGGGPTPPAHTGTHRHTHQHTHTPLSTGDASSRRRHRQLPVRVALTLGWCRNLSTAGLTQLKPERRSTKSGSSVWSPGLPIPAGTGRCSSRLRRAPSGTASSADRGPASLRGDPDRLRKTPAIGSYRISSTMRWRDRGDGRSSTTLTCECGFFLFCSVDSVIVAYCSCYRVMFREAGAAVNFAFGHFQTAD